MFLSFHLIPQGIRRFLWEEEAHSIAVLQQQQKTYHPMNAWIYVPLIAIFHIQGGPEITERHTFRNNCKS